MLRFQSFAIKNQVIRASACLSSLDWEIRYAQEGVGAVISACVRALPEDVLCAWQEHIGRIHAYRCRYILQLGQPGAVRVLTYAPPAGLAGTFADTAARARWTGADGVELQAPRGSLEGSGRQLREIIQAVRKAVSRDFHVQVRLDAGTLLGMRAADMLSLLQSLEQSGIDAIHLAGDPAPRDAAAAQGVDAHAARLIRNAVQLPVLRNGPFSTPEEIAAALQDRSCDAVTLTRPLVRFSSGAEVFLRRAA